MGEKEIIEKQGYGSEKSILEGKSFPLYTEKEEKRAFKKYKKTKNPLLKKEIMEHYIRLVMQLARMYSIPGNPTTDFEDVLGEGIIGLSEAVEKYRPETGYRFTTYAYHWIRQAILRYISNNVSTIRRPVHVVEIKLKIQRLQREREIEGKEPHTWDEFQEILKLNDETTEKLSKEPEIEIISLNREINIGEHGDPTFLMD